ncbi:phage tail assembly chaperone [Pseudomonas marincola]|uniref:phage tail assembly chaperone n=1 Tax=Pseudomonas marincola TaxID=437900 RepID=UPI003B834909
MWKKTGFKPPELADQTDCPQELEYIWHWYWHIPKPVTFTELSHWSQLTHRNLRAWEADLLASLQRVWI